MIVLNKRAQSTGIAWFVGTIAIFFIFLVFFFLLSITKSDRNIDPTTTNGDSLDLLASQRMIFSILNSVVDINQFNAFTFIGFREVVCNNKLYSTFKNSNVALLIIPNYQSKYAEELRGLLQPALSKFSKQGVDSSFQIDFMDNCVGNINFNVKSLSTNSNIPSMENNPSAGFSSARFKSVIFDKIKFGLLREVKDV